MISSEKHNLSVDYYQHILLEIVELIAKGSHRVLDVGCGSGVLGEYLKHKECATEVVGIEIDALAAKEALTKLDRVFCVNLNQASVIDVLKDFDKALENYKKAWEMDPEFIEEDNMERIEEINVEFKTHINKLYQEMK